MYLVRFLVNFMVFCVFLLMFRDFTDLHMKFADPQQHEISEALIKGQDV